MTELAAVRCTGCGGTVRVVPGQPMPRCLFCGEAALVPTDPPEGIEAPIGAIPFAVDEGTVRGSFHEFATQSIWYPNDLRAAALELRPLLLPAWAWSGEVETHWTGLVSAATASGKRPVAGAERIRFGQILVPASRTLRLHELSQLGRYDERALGAFDEDRSEFPVELSEVTRSAARARAAAEMRARHERIIEDKHDLRQIRASSVALSMEGRPVLVPIWIGAYRYGKRTYRVLVHGQSGQLVGEAPVSWRKVLAAIAAGLGTLSLIVAIVLILLSR